MKPLSAFKLPPSLHGITYMLMAGLLFSFMNNSVHEATRYMHSTQIVLIRNLLTILSMGVWICAVHGPELLKTDRPHRHAIRAVFGVASIECWFHALGVMPLNEATALSFTGPLFVTLFAVLFLKERSTWPRWTALVIGFIGTMVILRPHAEAMNHGSWFVLASSALLGGSSILIKTMTKTEHPDTIVFYQGVMMAPLALIPALYFWRPLTWDGFYWAAIVTFWSTTAHLCMARAFRHSEVVVLMPLDFTRLIFTAAIAYAWYGELLDDTTLLGALLIVCGSVGGAAAGNQEVKRRLKRLLSVGRTGT